MLASPGIMVLAGAGDVVAVVFFVQLLASKDASNSAEAAIGVFFIKYGRIISG
ncbi:hypothetical protein GCM10011405_16980 [Rufibacter glacialis]|nr:hypothetical protein GCM10011405_16980 [Rufibacter glacialis]